MNRLLLATLLLVTVTACDSAGVSRRLELVYLPDQQQPIPAADLPIDLRVKNWIGQNDRGSRGGSCFWASLWMCVRASGREDIEQALAANLRNGYEGPEHLLSMCRKLDAINVPFVATEDGDPRLLEEASRSRRWTAISYYPAHAICFVGYYQLDGPAIEQLLEAGVPLITGAQRDHWRFMDRYDLADMQGQEVAILLDNNFPEQYIVVESKDRFLRSWRELYHGQGITPWLSPIMPYTYPRTITRDQANALAR